MAMSKKAEAQKFIMVGIAVVIGITLIGVLANQTFLAQHGDNSSSPAGTNVTGANIMLVGLLVLIAIIGIIVMVIRNTISKK